MKTSWLKTSPVKSSRGTGSLLIFLGVMALAWLPPAFAYKAERDTQTLIRELHEAPSVPYVSEEARASLSRDLKAADVLFTAQVTGVLLANMGIGGPPVPMTRLFFEDLKLHDGELKGGKSFLARASPDSFRMEKGGRVIVALARDSKKSKTMFVTRVVSADKGSLQILLEAIKARHQKKGESRCETEPEPEACEA